jgi:hypothetical protein
MSVYFWLKGDKFINAALQRDFSAPEMRGIGEALGEKGQLSRPFSMISRVFRVDGLTRDEERAAFPKIEASPAVDLAHDLGPKAKEDKPARAQQQPQIPRAA